MRRMLFVVFSHCRSCRWRRAGAVAQTAGLSLRRGGPELATYDVGAHNGTLIKTSSVTLPFAVQYVWQHPSTRYLYAAWSNGMQGDRHGVHAYRIDPATGALPPHGQPIEIRHRPVHLTVDANGTHVLVAYNNPSSLSVHKLNTDGTLGAK